LSLFTVTLLERRATQWRIARKYLRNEGQLSVFARTSVEGHAHLQFNRKWRPAGECHPSSKFNLRGNTTALSQTWRRRPTANLSHNVTHALRYFWSCAAARNCVGLKMMISFFAQP